MTFELDERTIDYGGRTVRLLLPDGTGNVVRTIRKGRFYELKFLEYIRSLGLGGTYLDVGANIGNHTVFFALFTNAANVIGLEASPEISEVLRANVGNNGLDDRVDTYNVAAGPSKGTVSLETKPADEVGGARVVSGGDVDQLPLDEFLDEDVRAVKIDVEGYELEVLNGARELLSKRQPEVFIEARTAHERRVLAAFLDGYGYYDIAAYNNTATYHFTTKLQDRKLRRILTTPYPIRRLLRHS